jgi:hypothetical protein
MTAQVAWVWREKLDHTADFKVVFVEPHMSIGEELVVLDTKRCRRHSVRVRLPPPAPPPPPPPPPLPN